MGWGVGIMTKRVFGYIVTIALSCGGVTAAWAQSDNGFTAGDWYMDENGNWVSNPVANDGLPPFILVQVVGNDDIQMVEVPSGLDIDNIKLPRRVLADLGIKVPIVALGRIPLNRIEGLGYHYDYPTETLELRPDPIARSPQVVVPDRPRQKTAVAESGFALGVNYDVSGQFYGAEDLEFQSATLDVDAFLSTPIGVLSSNHRVDYNEYNSETTTSRGDMVFTAPFQSKRVSLNIGDITTQSPWGRGVKLGGVQLHRNFDLDPLYQFEHRFSAKHLVTEPSTVDVYIDGALQFSKDIEPGEFSVSDLPFVKTGRETYVIIRDAQGGERRVNIPANNSTATLKPGRFSFSIAAGVEKESGSKPTYGHDLMFSAMARYGMADQWALGTHLEATQDYYALTLNSDLVVPGKAFFTGAIGASKYGNLTGVQLLTRVSTQLGPANVSLSSVRRSDGYRDMSYVASGGTSLPTFYEDYLNVSVPFGKHNFGVSIANRKTNGEYDTNVGLNYSTQLFESRVNLGLSAYHNLQDDETSMQLSLKTHLGEKLGSSGLRASRSKDGDFVTTASLIRPMGIKHGDYGYSLYHDFGNSANASTRANASLRTGYGVARADYRDGSYRNLNANFKGAFGIGRPGIAFGPEIRDSFAMVSTGVRGIPVQQNGQVVGKTNFMGAALVPGLRSYTHNRVSFDRRTLPDGYSATRTAARVVPHGNAGVNLTFGIEPISSATYVLVDAHDEPLPPETVITLNAIREEDFWVGYGGQIFLEKLKAQNTLMAEYNDTSCSVAFDFPSTASDDAAYKVLKCQ